MEGFCNVFIKVNTPIDWSVYERKHLLSFLCTQWLFGVYRKTLTYFQA